ncbi:MAG: RNA polymerase subunit sigma-24, partial [Myxococcales bacterium]|nr:RNA polymerase subunit sigma-24 [Myxococcales bacterium]
DMTVSPLERVTSTAESPFLQGAEDQKEFFHRLFSDEVSDALASVPVDFRMVVLLVDVYDFAYKEAAEILGCPIGTVMSRLYRGRKILQEKLVDYAVAEGIVPAEEERPAKGKVVPFPGAHERSTG